MEKPKLKVAVVVSEAEARIALAEKACDVAILELGCELQGCCDFPFCKLYFKDPITEASIFEHPLLRPHSKGWVIYNSSSAIIHDVKKFFIVDELDNQEQSES